jgi:hypothetical protein
MTREEILARLAWLEELLKRLQPRPTGKPPTKH